MIPAFETSITYRSANEPEIKLQFGAHVLYLRPVGEAQTEHFEWRIFPRDGEVITVERG
jgi:hypothetical protein